MGLQPDWTQPIAFGKTNRIVELSVGQNMSGCRSTEGKQPHCPTLSTRRKTTRRNGSFIKAGGNLWIGASSDATYFYKFLSKIVT